MAAKLALLILSFLNAITYSDTMFYLYDRVNNKAITYHYTDCGQIYYTSKNFHSVDYVTKYNTTAIPGIKLRKINTTKSLPDIRSLHYSV